MRIVLFGAGSPLSLSCFRALQGDGLAAVVVPGPRLRLPLRTLRRALAQRRGAGALRDAARVTNLPAIPFDVKNAKAAANALAAIGADLFCIGAFPSILPPDILSLPGKGTINIHFSLLPRHRGPSPLPMTYLADDRVAGTTIHWVNDRPDAGDVIAQDELPLTRGRPAADLYEELCRRSAVLLAATIRDLAAGHEVRRPQPASFDEPDHALDLLTWPAERVWHVLSGLGDRFGPLLRIEGSALPHGRATGYSNTPHAQPPGRIERTREGFRVFCMDGIVDVERRSVVSRLRGRLARAML